MYELKAVGVCRNCGLTLEHSMDLYENKSEEPYYLVYGNGNIIDKFMHNCGNNQSGIVDIKFYTEIENGTPKN